MHWRRRWFGRTPFCDLLGVEYPILSVGFPERALAELVSAVSRAGGFGVLGASRAKPDDIRAEAERTRALTDRPFEFNLIIAIAGSDEEGGGAYVRAVIATAAGRVG